MPRVSDDEAALLRAVCLVPADDLPRLVYADWLDEHDRPERAEFIRLQCEVEGVTDEWERRRLAGRAADLLTANREAWFRELPKWARSWYDPFMASQIEYRRGFAESLIVFASPFLRFGDRLLDRFPLSTLSLVHVHRLLPRLARCPWLGRVRKLDLGYERVRDAGVVALTESPRLRGVRELTLSDNGIGDIGAKALAGCRFLAGLRVLVLRWNDLSVGGVKALAHSPFLRKLERLELRGNDQLRGHEDRVAGWFGDRAVLE